MHKHSFKINRRTSSVWWINFYCASCSVVCSLERLALTPRTYVGFDLVQGVEIRSAYINGVQI